MPGTDAAVILLVLTVAQNRHKKHTRCTGSKNEQRAKPALAAAQDSWSVRRTLKRRENRAVRTRNILNAGTTVVPLLVRAGARELRELHL